MDKRKLRKLRGELICRVTGEKIIEPDKGKTIGKSIRKNVLEDVRTLLNEGKSPKEIHEELYKKYHFRDYNPFEKRYIEYLRITRKMLSDTETDANEFLIYHKELVTDYTRFDNIIKSSLNEVKPGVFITRCEHLLFPIPTIPRTLQKRSNKQSKERIEKYKSYLRKEFEKKKKILNIVKDKEILLYIVAYLSKKRHTGLDVDNLPKHFCDVLKEFIGDDKLIQLLIVEKHEVDTKNIEEELCEEFLIFIAHDSFKGYLFVK